MARWKEELVEEIQVLDKDDERHTLYVFRRFTEFEDVATGAVTWAPASRRFATSDGEDVNVKDDGTFVELMSGRVLRRATG